MGLEVPPRGSRGQGYPGFLRWLMGPLIRIQVSSYRRRARGQDQPRLMDFPGVVLTTVGARSGRTRTSPLGGFPDGPQAWLVVASAGGGASHPGWFFNLARNPDQVWLEVGSRKMRVRAELLKDAQREAALKRIAAISPRYAGYQSKTDREIPIVRLTPAG